MASKKNTVFDYRKYETKRDTVLKDPRNSMEKFRDKLRNPETTVTVFGMSAMLVYFDPTGFTADVIFLYNSIYFLWLILAGRKFELPYKMPKSANKMDPNNKAPGTNKVRPADGILFIGNEEKSNEEVWFTNNDARTHILYLGTTGSGKTEGLKAMVTNALGWGSGFIYIDGKADTDLWGSISGLARRFGRDDDLLILNYMTGNSDNKIASNTVNPFSHGSASYIVNLLVSLMPDVAGDNAMWKDRAVALAAALMPLLTWQRKYQERVLNIQTIRDSLRLEKIIELSRRAEIPERMRKSLKGYLHELPGFQDTYFNDDGTEKPNASGGPPADYTTIRQQHGYLTMQFTRQLQSLSEDYGYIFETPAADIDMMDVVLNRRILVVLIPALEKSADETANLGKIVGSMLKGMMGATLGSTIEGDTDLALENKPTRSSTPFMAVFDEVGYYTTQGMAVMAAQARSLGFSLVFAGQDLPALEKRIKEEARSITANCNLKIFGKLEDPTQTKEFFEKTVGETTVIESSTRKEVKGMFGQKRLDASDSFNVTSRAKASYDQLKGFKEGQSVVAFGERVVQVKMFYSNVGKIKSLRVNKFIAMPHPDPDGKRAGKEVDAILERIRDKKWTAEKAGGKLTEEPVIDMLLKHFESARLAKRNANEAACYALTQTSFETGLLDPKGVKGDTSSGSAKAPALAETTANPAAAAPPVSLPFNSQQDKVIPPLETKPIADAPVREPVHAAAVAPAQKEEGVPAAITQDTMNWASLLDEAPETEPVEKPVAKALEPVAPPVGAPSVSDSTSWKDLLDDKPATGGNAPAKPMTIPSGGFGVGGFGTGFGGIGGLGGGVSFPQPPSAGAATSPAKPEKEIEKAVEEGETLNWKDLF